MKEVEIPGLGVVEFPDSMSMRDIALAIERDILPSIQKQKPPEEGFIPSLLGGAQRFASTLGTTGQAIFGSPEEAAKAGLARQEEISRKFAPGADLEAVKRAYAERGLLPAAGEIVSQIPTALAEQFPNIAAALASGRAGAMAGARFGPKGALIGGIGGALAPAFGQLTGSALERQAAENVENISLGRAAAAAAPGAALEVGATFIPLGRTIIGKILGPKAEEALAKSATDATAKANARLVEQGLTRTLTTGAAVGVGLEVPTEVIQQMLERLQAGLPLTDDAALSEYGQAAYGAGLVGAPFGAVGRVGQRSVARGEVEKRQAIERARLAQEEREKEEAAAQAEVARRAGAPLLSAEEATMGAEFSAYDAEGKLKEKQQLQTEIQQEYNALYRQEVNLEDQIKRAQKEGRIASIRSLVAERKRINELRTKLEQRVKDKKDSLFGLKLEEPTLLETADLEADVQADIDAVRKRLEKAIDLGDFDKVDTFTQQLEKLKDKARSLREQPDLFGTRYQTRLEFEEKERAEADAEMQALQYESLRQLVTTNFQTLVDSIRGFRQKRKQTQDERELEIQQDRALKRLEFNIDRRGLTALGIPADDMPRIESDISKGILPPELSKEFGIFDDDLAVAQRKVKSAEDKAQKDAAKAELTELQAEAVKPQRAIDVLDKIDVAWEKATAKQRELALDLAANKLELFDVQGKLTPAGAEAVRNQVAVEQLTTLRSIGRESRDIAQSELDQQQALALEEAGLSGAQQFGAAAAQATRILPQQRLQKRRERIENQIESINDQIRYLQSIPTVEFPGEVEFDEQIKDLELERREFEAVLAGVKRELGDEVEFAKPTDMNQSLRDFSDAIYPLQYGKFLGKRPTELTKTGKPTKAALAEEKRNAELQSKIDGFQTKLNIVNRQLLDPGLRNVDTRNALMRDKSRLEGLIKTHSAGLSKQAGGKATFQMLVKRAEQARDAYINAAINQINGVRAVRNLEQIAGDAEQKLRQELESKFNEFIKRASIAQRVSTTPLPKSIVKKAETALGAALEEAGVKPKLGKPKVRIPLERAPFAKVREALDVLREDLDNTLATARGDVAPVQPKFELKDYLEIILQRKAQAPARRIPGSSQIETIADSLKRIDDKLENLAGIEAGPDFITGLKQRIATLKEKPAKLRQLQQLLARLPKDQMDLYEDDPIIGFYLKNPQALQDLFQEVRREIPMLEATLAQEQTKVKQKQALEKLRAAKETERDAVIKAASEARGVSEELLTKQEVRRIQELISQQQKQVQNLANNIFDASRAVKVNLPGTIQRLTKDIAELTALAKTDKNPALRLKKVERLEAELSQARADKAALSQAIPQMQQYKAELQRSNEALAKQLRAMGVETTINNQGEYILTQIENAEDIKESVEANTLLEEVPRLRKARDEFETKIKELSKENNQLSRQAKLLVPKEREAAYKQRSINARLIESHKTELARLDKKIAQIIGRGGVEKKTLEGRFSFAQIQKAKKALFTRIDQTEARLAKLKMAPAKEKTLESVLERARIGEIKSIGGKKVVFEVGDKKVVYEIGGRKVVFKDSELTYALTPEEIEAQKKAKEATYGPELEKLRAEFAERKKELADVKASPEAVALKKAVETAKKAIKTQKNEKDGIRLAQRANELEEKYTKLIESKLSFPIEELSRYPLELARVTKLQNAIATVRTVPTKKVTTTELFVSNATVEKEAARQRFELSLKKDKAKPVYEQAKALVEEATDLMNEAKKDLDRAEASGNRALITAAKAKYLAYQRAQGTAVMKLAQIEVNLNKAAAPKTASDAAVNAYVDLNQELSQADNERLRDIINEYNINKDTSWAIGEPVTEVIDMDAAVKRMEEVVAKAAKRGIKVKYWQNYANMSLKDLKELSEKLVRQGKDIYANEVQGGVDPDGTVFVIIGHHNNLLDLEKTIAHEIIGHYTIDSLLGRDGLVKLLRRIDTTFGAEKGKGLLKLAEKLGVGSEVAGVYHDSVERYAQAVKEGRLTQAEADEFAKLTALRELIAYTTEKRIPKGIAATVKQFLQELVGMVRQALRNMGLLDASKISTSEIYNLIRSARERFEDGKPIAYRTISGDVALRGGQTAKWDSSVSLDIINTVNKVIAKTPTVWEKIRANTMGLNFRTEFVDSIDSLERIKSRGLAKGLLTAVQAVDLTYFYRMWNQRMSFVAEAATNGVVQLVEKKRADGLVERVLSRDVQKDAPSLKKVVLALAQAGFGDAKANGDFFTLYMAAERALGVGKEKLDYTNTLTEKELDTVRTLGRKNAAIQQARKIYNDYNKDLISLLVQAGAISKQKAAALLAKGDYIPYYRQTKDGLVNLWIEGEKILKIGSITEQPHLKELVGGRLDTDAAKSQPIEDFFTSSLQNTSMIMDLALRNLATRNVAFVLNGLGLAKRISSKATGINVIRANVDGEDTAWEISTEGSEVFGDIPAEIIVKGLDGIKTVLPEIMKLGAIPADFFRKLITRDPRYAIRQVFRDSMAAYMATGSDAKPLIDTTGELLKIYQKQGSLEARQLAARGIVGGQVITGDLQDMSKILMQMTGGRTGWEMAMAKLDSFAMAGDSATRVSAYNSFLRQGLSEREATLATLETMNFSRRGVSPSVLYLNTLIPFFSANLQGLDVLYRAFRGQMPESQRLKVQQKLAARGAMMFVLTIAYAAMMDDDEAYENADSLDRYSNWFVKIPGIKEPFKVPIPFELGWIFKAIPEGLVRAAKSEETGAQIMTDLAKMLARSIPGDIPLVMKPALEVLMDYSLFTGESVVSARLAGLSKEFQYTSKTPEAIKHLGAGLSFRIGDKEYGLSPKQIEHLVRGYTGSFPLSILGMTDPVFRGFTAPNAIRPSMRVTDIPVIGGLFQPVDAGGLIERAYETARAADKANKTYKDLISRGLKDEAKEYRAENAELLAVVKPSGRLTKQIGEISKRIRIIESLPEERMSAEKKRERIDNLRSQQIKIAKNYLGVREKIESRISQQ